MNILLLFAITIVIYFLAYRYYAGIIGRKFKSNNANKTPAVMLRDDVDYVPTKLPVVFSHHFASIAGAGPIIGPTLALAYGFLPPWLWIVFGSIFIGAVHDYSALFVSLREKGLSIAEIARKSMGKAGFGIFILFTIFMIMLVTGAFLSLTATALTSKTPIEVLKLPADQTLLRTEQDAKGNLLALIGGIASTSVIIITLFAPLMGFLLYKKNINVNIAILMAIFVCILSIHIGLKIPVTLTPFWWMVILSVYCLFAAGIPVWLILQPRDFINSFILYAGIIAMSAGIIWGGLKGFKIEAPITEINFGALKNGILWPMLFITVACGAISGFHALVAGGTTSKQCSLESHAKTIGFGGMLLEGVLAVVVLISISCGLDFEQYKQIVWPNIATKQGNPVLAFALGMAGILNSTFGLKMYLGAVFGILLVEGFLATTLDTAVRLNRYLFEELWRIIFKNPPKILMSYFFNSAISVFIMFFLAYTQGFKLIWPVFGSANQLLAGLTLIAVSLWFISRGAKAGLIFILPAVFMMITTITSLSYLLLKSNGYIATKNHTLIIADIALIILGIGVIITAINTYLSYKSGKRKIIEDPLLKQV